MYVPGIFESSSFITLEGQRRIKMWKELISVKCIENKVAVQMPNFKLKNLRLKVYVDLYKVKTLFFSDKFPHFLSFLKLENIDVTGILIVIGALGMVPKDLERELKIRGRAETIQTTVLLMSARILRRVLESCGYLQSLSLQ